jgi:hypothetical protein
LPPAVDGATANKNAFQSLDPETVLVRVPVDTPDDGPASVAITATALLVLSVLDCVHWSAIGLGVLIVSPEPTAPPR